MISMEAIIYIVVAIVAIVAVRIAITFDINKWQESRRERQKVKFQNICPHVNLKKRGDQFIIENLMVSPSGTEYWYCQKCKRVSYTGMSEDDINHWKNNPVGLVEQLRLLNKQAKKMKLI